MGGAMSYSVDDTYTVYSETLPKGVKPRKCDACNELIPVGHRYAHIFWVFEKSAESVVRCLRCQEIHKHLRHLAEGETWPDERLACGEDYEDEWGVPPPEDVAALAFTLPDEMQKPVA